MASTVPVDCRAMWLGTAATIPANWSRDTNFDDRYMQGDGDSYTGPANGGGNHTHTDNTHVHGIGNHRHDISATSTTASALATNTGTASIVAPATHDHVAEPSGTVDTGSAVNVNSAFTLTAATTSRTLQRIDPYIIAPDDGSQDIPDEVHCITDESTPPTGFTIYNDIVGDFSGIFMRGKDSGASGFITYYGPTAHNHATSGHTHTSSGNHDHFEELCGLFTGAGTNAGSGGATRRPGAHHLVTLQLASAGDLATESPNSGSAVKEPLYIDMLSIRNTSGGATTPIGVILPYVGSLDDDIPDGWSYCDGTGGTPDLRDRMIRLTENTGEIGDTGGSNTHSHIAGGGHQHVYASGHVHTLVETDSGSQATGMFGFQAVRTTVDHSHSWTVESVTPTSGLQGFTTDVIDGRPGYRTVVFVKKTSEPSVSEQPSLALGINF